MSLRWRTLLPLALCALVALGAVSWWDSLGRAARWDWLLVAMLLLAALWLVVEFLVYRPIAALLETKQGGDEIAALKTHLGELNHALTQKDIELAQAAKLRDEAAHALREHEERYALAVRGANDGLWEWDIASGNMYLSPRWKIMLGFSEDQIKDHIEAWKNQIHPADRPTVDAALAAHIEGKSPRFESQHRVMHRDTSFRWVLSRAAALRHASGKAYRMTGLDTDITRYRRMEEILRHVAEGTAGATGDEFFRELVKHFATVLGARRAFITECMDYPTTHVRRLATWESGNFIDTGEVELAGTPCDDVIQGNKVCFYPHSLQVAYPFEKKLGLHSYLGIPINDSRGTVIGHLAFLDEKAMSEDMSLATVYKIFTARAAAELERRHAQRLMLELAKGLALARGEESFRTLAKTFATVTEMPEAFVAQCTEQPPRRMQMLAWWQGGEFAEPLSYDLAGSTCEETILQGRTCFYEQGVSEYFPYAKVYNWEAYLSVPCFDAQGRVVGHLAALDNKPYRRAPPDEVILNLFAERAARELSRKHLNETLLSVADKLSTLRGEECFREMVKDLCRALGVREAFVCECADFPTSRVRMLAYWNKGEYQPCEEFDLRGTTCEDVIRDQQPLYVAKSLGTRWPLEKEFDRESYLGIPCFDSARRVIGHIACMDGKPMPESSPEWAILKIFAERAAIELERKQLTEARQPVAIAAK
jgi:PAS domain S-box-containing protein